MDHSRKCMSIEAIVDHNTTSELPLSPPDSFKSRSPTLSPNMEYMTCSSPTTSERRNSFQLPMSVEERRYRNKLASAKYRAKKQASMKSMTSKVSQLMTSNSSLQRELSKVKQENEVLRAMLMTQQQQNSASSVAPPPQSQTHLQTSAFY
ncbi:unnamed protein product [Mucor fragilis]